MVEREKSKEHKERQVLVCRAITVWRPNQFPNTKWLFVDDTDQPGSEFYNPTAFSLEDVAKTLINRGNSFDLILTPEVRVELLWADGYFGRPAIPVEVIQLLPLKKKDIVEFNHHLFESGYLPIPNKKNG